MVDYYADLFTAMNREHGRDQQACRQLFAEALRAGSESDKKTAVDLHDALLKEQCEQYDREVDT